MERNIILGILGITVISLIIALLLPSGKSPEINPRLPWIVDVDPSGASTVFDLTLGHSTMADARKVFAADGKANIFISPGGAISLEAYFERLYISGIKADVVLSLSLNPEVLENIYKRGIRISQLGDGSKKVTIAPDDMGIVSTAVVERITYLPAAKLDQELIGNRFGPPDSIIKENSGIEHWLYPAKGLDIALNPEGKEIFQYVKPENFNKVMQPLREIKSSRAGK